jgi:DNA replicative helicase MCM subunit Mcm2 (Cdc46/Mcm family)
VKESGIHQLYIVANSLQCVKASGDRDRSIENKAAEIHSSYGSGNGHDEDKESHRESETGSTTTTIGIGRPSLVCFTPSELESVRRIALSDGPGGSMGLLVASLCPTIFGHELVKLGLLLGDISHLQVI